MFAMGFRGRPPDFGRTLGSVIAVASYVGDLTAGTGLAGIFNGVTVGTNAAAGFRTGGVTSGYAGGNLSASPKRIFQVDLWPTTNLGYSDPALTSFDFALYGKNGSAPMSATDGTQLGTLSVGNPTVGPQTIVSTDQETQWDYVWVHHDNADGTLYFVELEFYEAV